MDTLTAAQARYLDEIRVAGVRAYNGRARKPVEALARLGLITYEYELVPHWNGRYTERYTCRPVA